MNFGTCFAMTCMVNLGLTPFNVAACRNLIEGISVEVRAAQHFVAVARQVEALSRIGTKKIQMRPLTLAYPVEKAIAILPKTPGAIVFGFGTSVDKQNAAVAEIGMCQSKCEAQTSRTSAGDDVVVGRSPYRFHREGGSLQVGYDFLWVAGIASATRQFNLDQRDLNAIDVGGQTFYNGFSFGFNGSW